MALDSRNARVWASLAKCYNLQAQWGGISRNEGFQKAEKTALQALVLDDKQVDAYRILGEVKMYDFNWKGAENEYKKALAIEPKNPEVLRIMGFLYRCTGRYAEAIEWTKQSISLDPLKPITYFNYGQLLYYANHLEEAITAYKKVLELNSQFPRAHAFLGKVYLLQEKPQLALAEIQKETSEAWRSFNTILCYQALGRREEAAALLNDYLIKFPTDESYQIAEMYAMRGENSKAIEWLQKAQADREARMTYVKGDPLLKSVSNEERYLSLLKKMNLFE